MADIKAIRERVSKATEGPWTQDLYYIVGQLPEGRPGGEVIGELRATRYIGNDPAYPNSQKDANADFIAHARQDIPDLLDFIDKYGGHTDDCNYCSGVLKRWPARKCDCGYDEAMKGLGIVSVSKEE